jgi:hypothetical protein
LCSLRWLLTEENGRRQSNRGNDCKQPNANTAKQRGAEHEHHARVANFPLVVERIAFDKQECESGSGQTQTDGASTDTTRWREWRGQGDLTELDDANGSTVCDWLPSVEATGLPDLNRLPDR